VPRLAIIIDTVVVGLARVVTTTEFFVGSGVQLTLYGVRWQSFVLRKKGTQIARG